MTTTTLTLTEFLLARIAEDEAEARADAELYWQDLARVLAECEAKRRIVENFAAGASTVQFGARPGWTTVQFVLRHLAAVYADHPDYREEWRP